MQELLKMESHLIGGCNMLVGGGGNRYGVRDVVRGADLAAKLLDAKRQRCEEAEPLSKEDTKLLSHYGTKFVSEINFVNNCEEYESIVGWDCYPNKEKSIQSYPSPEFLNSLPFIKKFYPAPRWSEGKVTEVAHENNDNLCEYEPQQSLSVVIPSASAGIQPIANSIQLQGKKNNFPETVHSPFTTHHSLKKFAFTLAEILITLGIIGVVAALTIPSIIQNYKKSVIETSVKKFYTNINQAIIMSERDNGDMHEWSRTDWDGDGAQTWDTYFDKYMITIKRMKTRDGKNTIFVFSDGSGLRINASDFFWCVKADYVDDFYKYNKSAQCMLFGFYPTYPVSGSKDCVIANYRDKGVEPYIHGSSNCSRINDPEYLCNGAYNEYYYARALQINGWKFPKNCQIGH